MSPARLRSLLAMVAVLAPLGARAAEGEWGLGPAETNVAGVIEHARATAAHNARHVRAAGLPADAVEHQGKIVERFAELVAAAGPDLRSYDGLGEDPEFIRYAFRHGDRVVHLVMTRLGRSHGAGADLSVRSGDKTLERMSFGGFTRQRGARADVYVERDGKPVAHRLYYPLPRRSYLLLEGKTAHFVDRGTSTRVDRHVADRLFMLNFGKLRTPSWDVSIGALKSAGLTPVVDGKGVIHLRRGPAFSRETLRPYVTYVSRAKDGTRAHLRRLPSASGR